MMTDRPGLRAAILAAVLLAFPVAAAEPSAPGARTLTFVDAGRDRKLVVELWYAPEPGAASAVEPLRAPLRGLRVARDAKRRPAPPAPLILASHGGFGNRLSLGHLAAPLAVAGYVVASVTHPGTSAEDFSADGVARLEQRALDLSHVLDRLLADPEWVPAIDAGRVGVLGHSFGGWAAISLAGGRYDPVRMSAFCAENRTLDAFCREFLPGRATVKWDEPGRLYADRRVRAAAILATGPAFGFEPRSLAAISIPFHVDTAEHDVVVAPAPNSAYVAANVSGARHTRRPVGHFSYVPVCEAAAGPAVPVCADPPGVDRAALHADVVRDLRDFFDRTIGAR
jgi:predicted dienelactone hydrolase